MLESLASADGFPSTFAVLATAYVCLKLLARHLPRRRATGPAAPAAEVPQGLAELMNLAERAPTREVQVAAIHSLGERAAREAIPLLGRLLASRDPLIASEAANSLGSIGDPSALTYLEHAASSLELELTAAMELPAADGSHPRPGEHSQPAWERILPPLARSNYRVFDKFTPHDIRSRNETEIVEMLLSIAAGADEQVATRYHAIKNLELFRHPEVGRALEKMLGDEHAMVRYAAAEALAVHGSDDCVDRLLTALEDRNRFVRSSAAMTLAVLASDRAIIPLKKLLDDPDDVVRYSAEKALASIGKKKRITSLLSRSERRR